MRASIPIHPVYNGDNKPDDIKAIIDGKVEGLEKSSEHFGLVRYIFDNQQIQELGRRKTPPKWLKSGATWRHP